MNSSLHSELESELEETRSSVFERSVNSKFSDWTSVFDPSVELSPYLLENVEDVHSTRSHHSSTTSEMDAAQSQKLELQERFEQGCATLLADIRRAFEDWDAGQEVVLSDLLERQALVGARAHDLAQTQPGMAEFVQCKLTTISIELDKLRLKQESDGKNGFKDNSAAVHLRKWLQQGESQLHSVKEETLCVINSQPDLQRLRATLQALQLEIDTEGRQLLRAAKRHLTNRALEPTADSRKIERLQRNLEVLEQRWLNLYLGGIEQIERISNIVQHFEADELGSDLESVSSQEPPPKRARVRDDETDEEEEDTFDLAMAERSAEQPGLAVDVEDGWSSSRTHDVGYSSGENSLHESAADSASSKRAWMQSPALVSSYYKTVPLDDAGVTDNETPRLPVPGIVVDLPEEDVACPDSVVVALPVDTTEDYREVMHIMDEQLRPTDGMGTSWKELKTVLQNRQSTPSKTKRSVNNNSGKMSCDASSEDSDVPKQMSESFGGWPSNFHKSSTPLAVIGSSLRKRRRQRSSTRTCTGSLSNTFLKSINMDQSVYDEVECDNVMSQSLNLSSRALSVRRRFLRRRMPRSVSDNASVAGKTPIGRRDSLHSNSSSTTFQDMGDAHFEWDEYRDESVEEAVLPGSLVSSPSTAPLLAPLLVDDDFQAELPLDEMSVEVAEFCAQSRAALLDAERRLKKPDSKTEVAQIAAENLRGIRALMTGSINLDTAGVESLNDLHEAWLELVKSFDLPSDDALSPNEVVEVMDLFRTIKYHYQLFGSMCDGPDSKLVSESSLDDLRCSLRTRKRLFHQLRTNYMRMMTMVARVPNLAPELDKVMENINVLNGSVSNLENFYDLYCVREKVSELSGDVKELDAFLNGLNQRSVVDLNDSLAGRMREIGEELNHCQERMTALEHVCNGIISRIDELNQQNVDDDDLVCCHKFVKDFREMQRSLEQVKTRVDVLFKSFPNCRPRSQQHDDSYSDSSSIPDSNHNLRRRRTPPIRTEPQVCAPVPSRSFLRRVQSTWRKTPTVRAVFACMLLMSVGALLLGLMVDEEVFSRSGHWSFKFGPQLKYVAGAPPV